MSSARSRISTTLSNQPEFPVRHSFAHKKLAWFSAFLAWLLISKLSACATYISAFFERPSNLLAPSPTSATISLSVRLPDKIWGTAQLLHFYTVHVMLAVRRARVRTCPCMHSSYIHRCLRLGVHMLTTVHTDVDGPPRHVAVAKRQGVTMSFGVHPIPTERASKSRFGLLGWKSTVPTL